MCTSRVVIATGVLLAVALGLGVSDVAVAAPIPVLEYLFDDVSGTTVPNHGSLGTTGDATLATNTTVGTGGQPFVDSDYLEIDALGDKMSTADIDSLDTLNAFTLAFYVKPTVLGAWKDMMGDCDSGDANKIKGWNLQAMEGGVLSLRIWDGAAISSFSSPTGQLEEGTWHHYAIVANHLTETGTRNVTVDFYRDGQFVNTATISTDRQMADDADGFKIGNAMWDSELLAQYGRVALYDQALTADQVGDVYAETVPEPSTFVLLGLLGLGLAGYGWRRAR